MKATAFQTVLMTSLLLGAPALQAQGAKPVPYEEGLHYTTIENAPAGTPGEHELVEAFSYLCSHCNTFEPYLNAWKKNKPENVDFNRIAVVFGRGSWELYARGYVTAQMLNIGDEAHTAMMERLWTDKEIMRSMEELAAFYSQFGVDAEKFLATSKSFAVESRLSRDQRKVQEYGVTGTPTLILDGKYRVSPSPAVGNFDVMLDVVDFLIEQESAGPQQASAAAD
jgi:thiol:disulfide interchange protein DsbA